MRLSPKFTVALVRTPRLSPYHARFLVPLDFSKYDLRDYLYHAYSVKAFNIRSYVKQMPVRDTPAQPRHWFRPESKKYMTIEMEQPFVWPETPDLEPWGGSEKEKEKETEDAAKISRPREANEQRDAARKLREQVERLFKKEDNSVDDAIERKKKQRLPLGVDEQKKEDERTRRTHELRKMTRLELWEEKRTGKIVHGDERSQYTIKA
jgi:large subunit ribosomal protein L23